MRNELYYIRVAGAVWSMRLSPAQAAQLKDIAYHVDRAAHTTTTDPVMTIEGGDHRGHAVFQHTRLG